MKKEVPGHQEYDKEMKQSGKKAKVLKTNICFLFIA